MAVPGPRRRLGDGAGSRGPEPWLVAGGRRAMQSSTSRSLRQAGLGGAGQVNNPKHAHLESSGV